MARPVGFVGTAGDREILEGRGVQIAEDDDFTDLACTGVERRPAEPAGLFPDLERWAARDVHMHCLNPDRRGRPRRRARSLRRRASPTSIRGSAAE